MGREKKHDKHTHTHTHNYDDEQMKHTAKNIFIRNEASAMHPKTNRQRSEQQLTI